MITFQNKNEFLLDDLENRELTVSTLLIPQYLIPSLNSLIKQNGNNMTVYLKNLLFAYRTLTHSGLLPKPTSVKTEFQEKDQNLIRVGFRPNNSDWLELGEIALAFGKSRCWLFVYLLKLDIMGLWHLLIQAELNSAVPTIPNLELRVFFILERANDTFRRGYHVKV